MKRLKVLISAHELSPKLGSECGVGWNLVIRLAKYHDVTVLFAKTNQFGTSHYARDVENQIRENGPIPGVEFISIQQPFITKIANQINKWISFKEASTGFPPLYFLGYKYWQKAAYAEAKKLSRTQVFDLVHLVTAISYREPGYLWKLSTPFVWGPTSGIFNTPMKFVGRDGFKALFIEFFRRASNFFNQFFSGRIARAIHRSAFIYPVSTEDDSFFRKHGAKQTRILLEAGTLIFPGISIPENIVAPVSIVWCGRMVSSKGLNLFLQALNQCRFKSGEVAVKIIGGGPLMYSSQRLAKSLGINDIAWLGQVPRDEVFSHLQHADILVHTSYKEATPNVVVEALSLGTAVICHDAYGMSVAVNDTCGIKIPLISPKESIAGFSRAMSDLVADPVRLRSLRLNALRRAKELSWDTVAERMANDYLQICNRDEGSAN